MMNRDCRVFMVGDCLHQAISYLYRSIVNSGFGIWGGKIKIKPTEAYSGGPRVTSPGSRATSWHLFSGPVGRSVVVAATAAAAAAAVVVVARAGEFRI
jgi:hypothetical protein